MPLTVTACRLPRVHSRRSGVDEALLERGREAARALTDTEAPSSFLGTARDIAQDLMSLVAGGGGGGGGSGGSSALAAEAAEAAEAAGAHQPLAAVVTVDEDVAMAEADLARSGPQEAAEEVVATEVVATLAVAVEVAASKAALTAREAEDGQEMEPLGASQAVAAAADTSIATTTGDDGQIQGQAQIPSATESDVHSKVMEDGDEAIVDPATSAADGEAGVVVS